MILFREEEEGCIQNTIRMKQVSLFHEHMVLLIPEIMEEMVQNKKSLYYPYKEKPEFIWQSPNEEIQMTFQQMSQVLSKEQIYEAAIATAHLVKKHNPRIKIGRVHRFSGKQTIGWFVMDLYEGRKKHIKFIMEIDGYFTLGTMTYPAIEQEKWAVLVEYIFASIRRPVRETE